MVSAGATLAAVLMLVLVAAGQPADRPLGLMAVYGAVAGVYALSYVVTAVLWMRWQSAAHAVHSPDTQARAWWWLIPIANLVLPYRAVRDLVEAAGRSSSRVNVAGWWAAMLVAVLAHLHVDTTGGFFVQMLTAPPDLGQFDLAVRAVGLLAVPAAGLFALQIVRVLTPGYGDETFRTKRRGGRIWFTVAALVGLAVGAAVVAGTQGASREAQTVVDDYLQAARAEDPDALFETIHPQLGRFFNKQDTQRAFTQAPPLPEFEVTGYQPDTVEGMDAILVPMTTTVDRVEVIAKFTAVNDDGDWKVGGVWVNVESIDDAHALRQVGLSLGIPEERLNLPER